MLWKVFHWLLYPRSTHRQQVTGLAKLKLIFSWIMSSLLLVLSKILQRYSLTVICYDYDNSWSFLQFCTIFFILFDKTAHHISIQCFPQFYGYLNNGKPSRHSSDKLLKYFISVNAQKLGRKMFLIPEVYVCVFSTDFCTLSRVSFIVKIFKCDGKAILLAQICLLQEVRLKSMHSRLKHGLR